MYSNKILGYGYVNEVLKEEKCKSGLMYNINKIKYKACDIIDKCFDIDTANIVRTMLLNDYSTISKEIEEIFYQIGISHILVPSSTHLMYILLLFTYIISLVNIRLKYKEIISILIIGIYLFITNFAISIVRVFLIYIFTITLNHIYKDKVNKINILCLALFLIIIYNPFMIYNVGMLLSFGSILGIYFFNENIKGKLQYGLNKGNIKFFTRIIEMISITLSVQIVITPILANTFNTVYVLSIFANIIAVPLSGILLMLSIIFTVIYNIPFISTIFIFLIIVIVKCIIHICLFFNMLPFSKFIVFPFNILEIIIYFFTVYTLFFSKKYWWEFCEYGKAIAKNIGVKKIICIFFAIVILFIVYAIYDFTRLKVCFLDVGQGDSTHIQVYGKNILIDGGGTESEDFDIGDRVITPYLLHNRIKTLDYIFVSHFDKDHYQGLISVIQKFKVKNIIISKQYIKTKDFEEFMKLIDRENINVIVVKERERISINDKIYFDIVFPDNIFIPSTINNNSLVMKFNYYNFSILFTGDIENEVEKYLINAYPNILKSDILKVAHHGSVSSSMEEFLKLVSPKSALIGVGENNNYGHPSKEVIERFNSRNIQIFRTDVNGAIILSKWLYSNLHIKTMM